MARKGASPKHAAGGRITAAPPAPSPLWKQPRILVPCLIALAGAAAYSGSFRVPFLFDDRYHIVESERIRQLWPPWPILTHSSRPVLHLSLALNYALGGLDPRGYHLLNLAFHVLAALVLFGILRRTFDAIRLEPPPAASWLAGLIALLWLVHPLQTESVTYTIQRSESLMGLFYLLTLYCAIRAAGPRNRAGWTAAAAASLLCGVGTKGGVILTAPIVVALYDRVFLSRSWNRMARERWSLYLALAAMCCAYPFMLATAPEEWKESAGFGYGASPLQYALTQPGVILHYIRLTFWPAGLCLDYGWPLAAGAAAIGPPLLVVGALLAATLWAWRKRPELAFPGVWFFLILAPTSSFIPIADVAVEHRMYLPLAALVTASVIGIRVAGRNTSSSLRWIAAGLVVAVLTGLTIRRNADYESQLAIWEDTVRKSPGNPRAQYDLAAALEDAKRYPEALAHYRLAVDANPGYVDALNNLGHLLVVTGKVDDSLTYLRRALEIKPDLAVAHNTLGMALAQQGKPAEAVAEFRRALQGKPDYAEPRNNLGIVLAQQGQTAEAIAEWTAALRIDPNLADAQNNMAYAFSQMGRTREAIEHYERAIAIKPDYYQAAINFAALLASADPKDGGDLKRAVTLGEHACNLTHRREPDCLGTLSTIYARARRTEDAVQAAQSAVDLARAAGRQDLVPALQLRLDRYRLERAAPAR
jgi:protein O-mannosyl-transferase